MPRGGRRPGAGRPPGSKNRPKTEEQETEQEKAIREWCNRPRPVEPGAIIVGPDGTRFECGHHLVFTLRVLTTSPRSFSTPAEAREYLDQMMGSLYADDDLRQAAVEAYFAGLHEPT